MFKEVKYEKVDQDDPRRCQGVFKLGQCQFKAEEGSQYCKLHQGAGKTNTKTKAEQRNYKLAKWQARVNEFADSDQVKSLREEIGIARLTMESVLDRCEDSADLMLYSSKIMDHVNRIEKVVTTCHRLEQSSGMLLDKAVVLNVAGRIVDIISKHLDDPVVLEAISVDIIDAIYNYDKDTAEVIIE